MSRLSYSDDENYPGQFNLWQANCDRSMRGKKGQAVLRELEAALVAMPRKRLIAHAVAQDGDVCAVGALLAARREQAGESRESVTIALSAHNEDDTPKLAEEQGVPRLVAWKLVALNDVEIDGHYVVAQGPSPDHLADRYYGYRGGYQQWVPYTPEERYEKVLAWVRDELKPLAQFPSEAR